MAGIGIGLPSDGTCYNADDTGMAEQRRYFCRHAGCCPLGVACTAGRSGVRRSCLGFTVTGGATWGEGAAEVLGPAARATSLHDWLDLIDPSERALVQAAWHAVAEGERSTSDQSYTLRLPGRESLQVRERLAAVRGGDDRVERIVGLLDHAPKEPRHG